MLKTRIKKLEKVIMINNDDPYRHLSDEELSKLYEKVKRKDSRLKRERYRSIRKESKIRAQEFKELFIDTEGAFDFPPSLRMSKEEKIEILKKQMDWHLKNAKSEDEKQKIIELYESFIQHEKEF